MRLEVGGPRYEILRETEGGGLRLGAGVWRFEVSGLRLDVGGWRLEFGGLRLAILRLRLEVWQTLNLQPPTSNLKPQTSDPKL